MSEAFRALRHQTPFLVKCDQCGRVSKHSYRVAFGNFNYNLCSGQCVERSRANYEEKKDIKFTEVVERSLDNIGGDFE